MNILNKLTLKHMTMNKKRTIVTIIGVILSTALMVGIGLLLSTLRENAVDEAIESSGPWHAAFDHVAYDKINLIKQNNTVDKVVVINTVGFANKLSSTENYLRIVNGDTTALQELELTRGRLPQTSDEIVLSESTYSMSEKRYELGDKINLEVGELITDQDEIEFQKEKEKTYTIVGIAKRSYLENRMNYGSVVYTTNDFHEDDTSLVYVTYHKTKKTLEYNEAIQKNLMLTDEDVSNNSALLALNGVSTYSNVIQSLAGVLIIILTLVSIGCIIVIYNSFAISVMERKKQFGLFSSIGATKAQLRKTVFFEAFLVAIIGIPLGILGSYLGIGIVIMIINKLLPNVFMTSLKLCTYPLFIVIPIIFMIITIFVSAFLPARRASKITPIEAIRQNDDIKIKKNKLRSGKIVRHLFGMEGSLAHKNMKRNKKKYRITIASLVVSIVLFISFSSLMGYVLKGTDSYLGLLDYDILLTNYDEEKNKDGLKEILAHDQVDSSASYRMITFVSNSKLSYTDDMKEIFDVVDAEENMMGVQLLVMDDATFDAYSDKIGNDDHLPILLNTFESMVYTDSSRKFYSVEKYSKGNNPILLCSLKKEGTWTSSLENCDTQITDYVLSREEFKGISSFTPTYDPTFLIRNSDLSKYASENKESVNDRTMTLINAKKYDRLNTLIEELYDKGEMNGYYENVTEDMKLMHNFSIVAKLLVYGFITLVTLIGVTSVFNTIHTSISLRRKEFAMLRSMGLTPKGMNKMLYMESLFVGLKALFIGIPLALIVIVLLHISFSGIISFEQILIPWKNIVVAIIAVFIIVLLTMMYASRKIKKENILEAIREENI